MRLQRPNAALLLTIVRKSGILVQVGVSCARGLTPQGEGRRCATDPLPPCALTPDMLEMLREKPGDRHADPTAHSPTKVLDCPRKQALQVEHDWYLDVDDAWPLLRGHMVHAIFERDTARYPGALAILRETEMEWPIDTVYGPQRMTGKPDLVIVQAMDAETKRASVKIVDYKSTAEVKHELVSAKPDHVRQVNMYAWLVRRWLPAHYFKDEAVEVVVEELEIAYADFKKPRRFTSKGPLSARGKRTSKTKPWTYETLTLAPIHIYKD